MSRFYVGLATGSSGNTGLTSDSRKKTVAQALALASAGDTIVIGETFKPDNSSANAWNNTLFPSLTNATGIKLEFELGCEIWGMNSIAGTPDVNIPATNMYQSTLPTGLYIDAVYHNYTNTAGWYSGSDSRLIPNCQLVAVADATACAATPWSWHYDPATGIRSANCAGAAPNLLYGRGRNASSIYATTGGSAEYNGFAFVGCTNISGSGTLNFRSINASSATDGYGFYVSADSLNIRMSVHGTSDDMGYHGEGGAGTGNQSRSLIEHRDIGTCGPNSTHMVWFAGGANNTVYGCRFRWCKAHMLTHLKPDNSFVRSIVAMTGCFAHTHGDSGNFITDLEYADIEVFGYGYANTNAFNAANAATYSGSQFSEANRPVRFIRVNVHNGSRLSLSECPLIKDCQIDLASAGASGSSAIGAIIITSSPTGSVVKNRPLFAGCVVTANLDRGGTAVYCAHIKPGGSDEFTVGDGSSWMNCTVIDASTQSQDVYWFLYRTNVSIGGRGCAFMVATKTAASSFFCGSDNSIPDTDHDFKTCAYIGFATGAFGMSSNTSFDTQAEWAANIDNGTGVLACLFSSSYAGAAVISQTTGAIAKTSSLNVRRNPSSHVVRGINGLRFSGAYGAYQFGNGEIARTLEITEAKADELEQP